MIRKNKELNSNIKFYHTIILGCLFSSLLILNSNYVNSQREQEKLNKEKKKIFDKIIYGRYLEGEEDGAEKKSGTEQVCERGSQELKDYYKTGDLTKIKLDDKNIECEDKDSDYMKAIINIIKTTVGDVFGGDEEDDNNKNNDPEKGREPPEEPIEDGGRILNDEGEKKDSEDGSSEEINKDDIITYGKHILPVLIFFVVAILCIPGWLMCCFCCCCNCCCCCCCKKPCCKIPCFIITYALYALVVAVCFYGLSQSNHIFIGLADTECSILRFFDEVLEGESKESLPKWAGFEGIKDILNKILGKIDTLKGNANIQLNEQMRSIGEAKITFISDIKIAENHFKSPPDTDTSTYYNNYIIEYNDNVAKGKYILDIIKEFGTYNDESEEGEPDYSTLGLWVREYKEVLDIVDPQMDTVKNSFNDILNQNVGTVTNSLEQGVNTMDDVKGTFNNIKDTIAEIIVDNSGTIDDYGKLGFKAVFGVLALIDIAIAVFMLLLCFCSGKCCTKCCCCRCIFKLVTHLLWNILALLMIIVFLVGSLLSLIGRIGSDVMSVISFIVSEENISSEKPVLLGGQIKNYIDRCLNGDGQIENELGLGSSSINSFEEIKSAERDIETAKISFETFKRAKPAYTHTINQLQERKDLKSELLRLLLIEGEGPSQLSYLELLSYINANIPSNKNERWDIGCTSEYVCSNGNDGDIPNNICFQPKNCLPSNRDWIEEISETSNILKIKAGIIENMKNLIAFTDQEDTNDYKHVVDTLKDKYIIFLDSYITALDKFNSTIKEITTTIEKYTGKDGGIFSFVNCNFIGTNLKVILKYLKESLGGDLYTIGVCLILVGCSLALSISFTILLIIVINADVDNKKKGLNQVIPFK